MAVVAMTAQAQLPANPVSWTFTSIKVADKTYEVHMTATIQTGWHLYSQTQPDDAIPQPTVVTFNKNPLITLDGKGHGRWKNGEIQRSQAWVCLSIFIQG